MQSRTMAAVCLAIVVGSSGCAAVAAGGAAVGTYAYVKGVTEVLIEAPYNRVWTAMNDVLAEMELLHFQAKRDALSGKFTGELHDGTNVIVDVESLTPNTTQVKIRVGAFGDRAKQEDIADRLADRL